MKMQLSTLALLALCALACGPVGPFPGGRLGGAPGPDDVRSWEFAEDEDQIQVETRPEDPHSVNTWFVGLGSDLYVPTSMILGPKDPSERSWVAHVLADPEVRIRVGDLVYERIATRVEDPDEYAAARRALEQRYDLDPAERDASREVWIFRMDPRPARGVALLAPFKKELQTALREGMAQGIPEAITACRVRAPEIARTHSQDGVRVGRTSHRLRNPANAPPAWVAPLLAAYVADPSARAAKTVTIDDGRAGYVEPIVAQGLCLACHGSALAPEVSARIGELYPDDQAVGFASGDLRGLFWVEYPTARGR